MSFVLIVSLDSTIVTHTHKIWKLIRMIDLKFYDNLCLVLKIEVHFKILPCSSNDRLLMCMLYDNTGKVSYIRGLEL